MRESKATCSRLTVSIFSLLLFISSIYVGTTHAQMAEHAMHMGKSSSDKTVDVVRDPADVPSPLPSRPPAVVKVTLTAEEVIGQLDPSSGTTYRYWTFNGKVPAPMIRVRQNDTVEITLRNAPGSHMVHSVDFHAALGPGGGAAMSQAAPGQSKTFSFKATTPGLFVYHCGTPMIAEHIANGMYGLILVEPAGGLPHVDHEYYVMQGEFYTAAPKGKPGLQQFSAAKLMQEQPEYFVFNGAVDALAAQRPMRANVGETVRIFFGDAGPNETSSLHLVGEIFTKEYELGSLMSPPLVGIQTASVPPGGAAILELTAAMPGKFAMMDHAMARMAKGLMATLDVTGTQDATLMHQGSAVPAGANALSGMTAADERAATAIVGTQAPQFTAEMSHPGAMASMAKDRESPAKSQRHLASKSFSPRSTAEELNGCMTLLDDGRAMITPLNSQSQIRLEGQPFLFSKNANRLVHVSGRKGSVVESEDPNIPSFVVDSVDELAPNCSTKISAATIRQLLEKRNAAANATVRMNEMAFLPATLVVNAGERVTWKNSSAVTHNVVDDSSKALYKVDVALPDGGTPFDSGYLQPEKTFSRVFTVPGVYRYVCTLHETSGMKGTIIVRPGNPAADRTLTAQNTR